MHRASLAALLVLGVAGALVADVPAYANRVNATCANTTADAATIQSAITSSAAGDEIVIKGPCLLNATVKLLDDRTYRGDGTATTLKQANGANLAAMLASESWVDNDTWVSAGVRVERLTLDGNRANNTGTVPLMLRTWDSRVYDVRVFNAPSDGIRVSSLSKNGTHLTNTMVNSIISDVYIEGTGGAGVRVVDPDNYVTDWVLERSWISGVGTSGVDLDNSAGWQVRDLHIYGVPVHAINANRCYNTGIHDNYIEDYGAQGTAGSTYFGIRCVLQGDVPSTIAGNKVNQLGTLPSTGNFVGIGLDGVNYSTGYASVTGNAVVGTSTTRETGLAYAKGSGTALVVTSTGNLVARVGTARSVGTGVTVTAGQ
ncbi:hypothetical protein [Hamadaea tsunoensis]|uniref:hypothetical protein n=1 Tax=Hamadaea tsunoensis TaxID=53368 RepID=UPI0004248BE5|nr:hypothetical protein [Hamadaea tsunoensis]